MKKLFVIVLAAIGMVSCMNTDEVIEVNNDNAIAFADAFIENSVRAIIENGNDPDQFGQFNVWGWMKDTEGSGVEATVFKGKQVTKSGADWTYSDPQYWVPGFKYHFQALSSNGVNGWEATEATNQPGQVTTVSFTNNNGTEDLIYATASVDAPALGATKTVELSFNHQLAKVKFTLAYDDELSAALGNGMSVKADSIKMDVPKTGVLNLVSGDWSVGAETTTLEMKVSDERVSDERLTIPAENYTYAISFDVNLYKGGVKVKKLVTKTASVVLDVVKGCAYNFTATLTPDNLQMTTIDFTTEVADWNQYVDAGFEPSVAVVSDPFNLIEAAGDEDIKNIVLNNDINLNDLISRAANESPYITVNGELTIDLNGHNISGTDENTASFGLINVAAGASLNVINSADVEGKISLTATKDRNWDAYSSVISNQRGTLTVGEGVVIEHLGGTDMAYGIDNLTNTGAEKAITTIDGATVKSTYRAIRQFLNSTAKGVNNELYVKRGVIESTKTNKSIWMQNANANANPGKLVVEAAAELKGDVYLSATNAIAFPVEVSVAAAALKGESKVVESNFSYNYYVALENGVYVVKTGVSAAKLDDAIKGVADGGTITLAENVTIDENTRDWNSGTWYDGIYYVGDKSFTIDLNGKTLTHNGSVNDYLINLKNDGSKPNTVTIKNGVVDAGTTAFCALCTSSSNNHQITINLENVELINNMSNGSTIKVRGGAELNVKAGTKITGKNSYLGIEVVASTCNIYDGAEIYQNGTSSDLGGLVGVCGNGVANVYGGCGKSVRCGFIAMTSGGVINVAGGEWIANTDGTIGNNSNLYVLTAQNNKNESGYKGASIINVTGGTFRGGMDAWILNDVNVEKAELNIKGGNFNANPAQYLVEGYTATESDGIYSIVMGVSVLNDALAAGGEVILTSNIAVAKSEAVSNGYGVVGVQQLKGGVIDGNGKSVSVNAWGTWDSAINTTGGTIKNLNVTGGMRGIFISHNSTHSEKVVLENVTIDGTIYTISCDQGTNKGLEAYNSTFNGWTSYAATIGDVKFVGCSFGEGQGYAFCRPYAPTEFVNCAFAEGFELGAQAAVTFENCTIGGVALTAEHLATFVVEKPENATVK